MRNRTLILVLLLILVPQIVLAAWWNPFSWFNNWDFFRGTDSNTQVLEDRIQELEKKLDDVATSTAIAPSTEPEIKTIVEERIVYVPTKDTTEEIQPKLVEQAEKTPVTEITQTEEEDIVEQELIVKVLYTKQTPFNSKEDDYGGAYQIVMNMTVAGEDILIPQTTTDNSSSQVGFEYEITGNSLEKSFELRSAVSCPLKSNNNCKLTNDKAREVTVTVYVYPEEDGIFGVKFLGINYLQNGQLKTFELNKSTSKIQLRGF